MKPIFLLIFVCTACQFSHEEQEVVEKSYPPVVCPADRTDDTHFQVVAGGVGAFGYEGLLMPTTNKVTQSVPGVPFRIVDEMRKPRALSGFLDDSVLHWIVNYKSSKNENTINIGEHGVRVSGDLISLIPYSGSVEQEKTGDKYNLFYRFKLQGVTDISEMKIQIPKTDELAKRRIYLLVLREEQPSKIDQIAEGDLYEETKKELTIRWLTSFRSPTVVYLATAERQTSYEITYDSDDLSPGYKMIKHVYGVEATSETCGPVKEMPTLLSSKIRYADDSVELTDPLLPYQEAVSYIARLHEINPDLWSDYAIKANRADGWARFWHFNHMGDAVNLGWLSDKPCDAVSDFGTIEFGVGECKIEVPVLLSDKEIEMTSSNMLFDLLGNRVTSSNHPHMDLWFIFSLEGRPFIRYACDVTSIAIPDRAISIAHPLARCGVGLALEDK